MPVTIENDISPAFDVMGCLDSLDPITSGRASDLIVKECPENSVILSELNVAVARSCPDEAGF